MRTEDQLMFSQSWSRISGPYHTEANWVKRPWEDGPGWPKLDQTTDQGPWHEPAHQGLILVRGGSDIWLVLIFIIDLLLSTKMVRIKILSSQVKVSFCKPHWGYNILLKMISVVLHSQFKRWPKKYESDIDVREWLLLISIFFSVYLFAYQLR